MSRYSSIAIWCDIIDGEHDCIYDLNSKFIAKQELTHWLLLHYQPLKVSVTNFQRSAPIEKNGELPVNLVPEKFC